MPKTPSSASIEVSRSNVLEKAAGELLPQGLTLQAASDPAAPFEGLDSAGKTVWRAILPLKYSPGILGYAGPIELMVGVENPGKVTGVKILSHNETPTFVQGIEDEWFLGQFKGKTLGDSIMPFKDLDGITHATVTVEAICKSVKTALKYTGSVPEKRDSAVFDPKNTSRTSTIILVVSIVLIFLERWIPRFIVSFLLVLLLGFVSQQYLSLAHIQLICRNPMSACSIPFALLVFFVSAVLFTVFKARGYCIWVCPFGRLQELLGESGRLLPAKKQENDEPVFPPRLGRTIFWAVLIITPISIAFPGEKMEIFSAFFLFNQGIYGGLFVVSVLVGCLCVRRFYCRTLCPLNPFFEDVETFKNLFPSRIENEKGGKFNNES